MEKDLEAVRNSYKKMEDIMKQRVQALQQSLEKQTELVARLLEEKKVDQLRIRELEGKLLILVARYVPPEKKELFEKEFDRSFPVMGALKGGAAESSQSKLNIMRVQENEVIVDDPNEAMVGEEEGWIEEGDLEHDGEDGDDEQGQPVLDEIKTQSSGEEIRLEEAYEDHERTVICLRQKTTLIQMKKRRVHLHQERGHQHRTSLMVARRYQR